MNVIRPISVLALTGIIAAGAPALAQEQNSGNEMSVVAGHNVVDAVDDLRETTADLVDALIQAEEGLGFGDWEAKEAELVQMKNNLDQMEQTLDQKAEQTDSSWLNWMSDRDYTVTVKEQVNTLAGNLSEIAGMLQDANENVNLEVVVGHNLVDQVDDVRETTADLLYAVSDAGPQFGWFDDADRFSGALEELDDMEKNLDQKAEMTDAEWEALVASPDYRVTIHDSIDSLANTLQRISGQVSADGLVSQAN